MKYPLPKVCCVVEGRLNELCSLLCVDMSVFLDDLPDRNCNSCGQCCVDYSGWLQFQHGLYRIVRDPLFELAITICIVLNTMFLAMEHHGMSQSVLRALDIGNKVHTIYNKHKLQNHTTLSLQLLMQYIRLYRFSLPYLHLNAS